METLNEHEKRILRFIERYENRFGRTPSYEEIRKGTGMKSKDHVYREVTALERRHYVRREPGITRGITLMRTADGYPVTPFAYSIPVVGASILQAPVPLLAEPKPPDWIEITRAMIPDAEDVFAIRVKGDSMVDALVHDGDTIVIKRQTTAADGELVAVHLKQDPPGQVSLKRSFRRGDQVWLRPENPAIAGRRYKDEEVEIRGMVLCIIRNVRNPLQAA